MALDERFLALFKGDKRLDFLASSFFVARIMSAQLWVFSAPDLKSARLSEFIYGECVRVGERRGDFYYVQSLRDGYCGWVHAPFWQKIDEMEAPSWRTAVIAPLYCAPDLKSEIVDVLPMNALFRVVRFSGDYALLPDGRYLHIAHIVPLQRFFSPVEVARWCLGKSYVWGGRGVYGVDCSALVQLCFSFAGYDLPRDSDMQAVFMQRFHQVVCEKTLMAGDLIFVKGHVLLCSALGRVIHASGHHMRVVEEDWQEAKARLIAQGIREFSFFRMRYCRCT